MVVVGQRCRRFVSGGVSMDDPDRLSYRYCEHCDRRVFGEFRCQWRFCPSRIRLYFGDQTQVLKVNLAAWGDLPVSMFSITAGGADTPHGCWDLQHCAGRGPHKHSGPAGCRVVRVEAAVWNASAPQRWGQLRDAVYSRVRRRFGKVRVVILGVVWQLQVRGLLHAHVVVGFEAGGLGEDVITFYRRSIRALLREYGFSGGRYGFHAGRTERYGARDAASYLAPYLSPDDGSLAEAVADMQRFAGVSEDGRRRSFRPVFIAPVLTKATGCTMAFLRFRRWVYAVWGRKLAKAMTAGEWRKFWELRREFGIVPTVGGSFAGRAPPLRWSHTERLNLHMALAFVGIGSRTPRAAPLYRQPWFRRVGSWCFRFETVEHFGTGYVCRAGRLPFARIKLGEATSRGLGSGHGVSRLSRCDCRAFDGDSRVGLGREHIRWSST